MPQDTTLAPPSTLPRDREIVADGRKSVAQGDKVWLHARDEFLSDVDRIMTTVIESGQPVVYGVGIGRELGAFDDHGAVRDHYTATYGAIHVRDWRTFIELRSNWYTFFDGVVNYDDHAAGENTNRESIVLFPLDDQEGILGELAWTRLPEQEIADPCLDPIPAATAKADVNRHLLDAYIAALKAGDVAGAVGMFTHDGQVAARDYGADPERYRALRGPELLSFHQRFADRFDVLALDIVRIVVTDWYAFAELHWHVREKASGKAMRMHTVEMLPILAPGKFVARIGWGTELVPDA